MMPKVETFEHNIVEEIKRKDASLTEISTASNNIGNSTEELVPRKKPTFLIVLACCFVLFLFGLAGVIYFYYTDPLLPPSSEEQVITPDSVPKATASFDKLSPTLSLAVGRFVTRVEKKEQGYNVTISEFAPVFAYMTRNENEYIEELALLFSAPETAPQQTESKKPEPAVVVPQVTATTTSTSTTSTTTKKTPSKTSKQATQATSTQTTSTTSPQQPKEEEAVVTVAGPHFTDITISNQNMRVWTSASGKRTVVYAFVGNNTVLIANTTEGILALKGGILK